MAYRKACTDQNRNTREQENRRLRLWNNRGGDEIPKEPVRNA